MLRLLSLLIAVLVLLVGCQSDAPEEPPPDPVELITESANNIRTSQTFRLEVRHAGAEYLVPVYITDNVTPVDVGFRRAVAQYVFPDRLHATVRVLLAGAAIEIETYSEGADQWFKLPGTNWVDGDYAPGFNPETLIAEDTGFQAALAALEEISYEGITSLEDGTSVYHLNGIANGPDVTALLVGLIEAEGDVMVDVFIDREERYPIRLVITQPETDPDDPTTWTIDVYDINAEAEPAPPVDAQ